MIIHFKCDPITILNKKDKSYQNEYNELTNVKQLILCTYNILNEKLDGNLTRLEYKYLKITLCYKKK